MMAPQIALTTVLVALIVQGFIWQQFEFVDKYMWADQAYYMQIGDQRQYDALAAYGHPGTVLMILTIVTHTAFGIPYATALVGSLTILNILILAGIAVVSYALRPNSWWWLVATGLPMFNRLLPAATPPSAMVSLLIVLLVLLACRLYEQAARSSRVTVSWWGVVLGLSLATRTDISAAVGGALWLCLSFRLGWRLSSLGLLVASVTFVGLNPFMWYMPLQHLADLFSKVAYHYAEYAPYHLSPVHVLLISPLAIISLMVATIFFVAGRRLPQPLPRVFLGWLLLLTLGLSTVFLTSHYQAPRYFFPLAFLWEVLLPLYVLQLIPQIHFDFLSTATAQQQAQRLIRIGIVTLLVAGQAVMLVHLWLMPTAIFVCLNQPNHHLFCNDAGVIQW